jgi:hypothetical protein
LSATCDLECEQLAQLFPERGRAIRLGRVNEKKWRLIDDDVIVSLIYDFEVEVWRNEVMD